jgi:hypothetical protein
MDKIEEALRTLVELKDIKERLEHLDKHGLQTLEEGTEYIRLQNDYEYRKEWAWAQAREALANDRQS